MHGVGEGPSGGKFKFAYGHAKCGIYGETSKDRCWIGGNWSLEFQEVCGECVNLRALGVDGCCMRIFVDSLKN